MKTSDRLPVIVLLIVLLTAALSLMGVYATRRHWTDGLGALRLVEVEEFWMSRMPLSLGLGTLCIVVVIGLLRSLRKKRWDEVATLVGFGAFGAIFLVSIVTFINRVGDPDSSPKELPSPRRPTDAFSRNQWQSLAQQTWREERPMGPLLEYGPGLRDFPGYLPFDRCLLERTTFEGMRTEQVTRVLGSPLLAIYPERQYLQYQMVEASPRGRIANLVLGLEFAIEQGQFVADEHLYPERVSAHCP